MSKKPKTTYAVRSALTGATVCGPYEDREDAEREVKRLNKEAATGQREKAAHKNERVADRQINFQIRLRCARCGHADPQRDRNGVLACPRCKSTEFEEAERVATAIREKGEPMAGAYEIQTAEGVIL